MANKRTVRRGISYPAFIIAVFVALAFAATAIVCVYQLYRSNQANYRAVQQLQASIAQLPAQPQEAPASLSEALSIVQGQFDSYQSSLSLTLAVAGVVFSLFALAVPLMNYFFFQKEQVEKLQAAAAQAEVLTAQAEALQEKTDEVTAQLEANQAQAARLEEAQQEQQQRFDNELQRVRNSTEQIQVVLASMNERRFTIDVKPLSDSMQDEVDALYLNALIARSSTHQIRCLEEAITKMPSDVRLWKLLSLVYYREHMFSELLDCVKKAKQNCTNITPADEASFSHDLGSAYRHLGKYDEAIALYHDAIAMFEKIPQAGHASVAWTYGGLGNAYCRKGEYAKAMEWYEKTRAIRENLLGVDHPDTALIYSSMGEALLNLARYQEATDYLHRALHVQRLTIGEYAYDTGFTHFRLAWFMSNQGEKAQALDYLMKAYYANQASSLKSYDLEHTDQIAALLLQYHNDEPTKDSTDYETWLGDMVNRYIHRK